MSRTIFVQRRVPPSGIPAPASLRRWAEAALGDHAGEIAIRIVGAREGRSLNRRYRGKDYATNVLSFWNDEAAAVPGLPVLGDLVLCAPVVAKEAAEQEKSQRAHWAHLVIHGCLHLLGYDHTNARDAGRMEGLERQILATFGFPDPYV